MCRFYGTSIAGRSHRASLEVDVWAMGVIMYGLVSGSRTAFDCPEAGSLIQEPSRFRLAGVQAFSLLSDGRRARFQSETCVLHDSNPFLAILNVDRLSFPS